MNIKAFKEGDIITRNEPMTYKHNGSADSSFCGQRLELLGLDENAKIIFLKEKLFDEPVELSYARDNWDEGWISYPETLYQKIKSKLTSRDNQKGAPTMCIQARENLRNENQQLQQGIHRRKNPPATT